MRTNTDFSTDFRYIWQGIKYRCINEKSTDYCRYGARGINIEPSWRNSYKAFKQYLIDSIGHRPRGKTLDRIDNNRGYVYGNLRWASPTEQAMNKGENPRLNVEVSQLDTTGKLLRHFESPVVARKFLNVHLRNYQIIECCNNERDTAHGYQWRWRY
jgi:hypothetical protein